MPFWQRFLKTVDTAFGFLVSEHGFQRIPAEPRATAPSPQDVWYLSFGKGDIAVAPATECSGPISVLIYRWDGGTTINWDGVKNIITLERLRCPKERLLPAQREDLTIAGIENILTHDAMIIRKYFPDILDGRFDLLDTDDVLSVRRHLAHSP